jgi:hypothetical protein
VTLVLFNVYAADNWLLGPARCVTCRVQDQSGRDVHELGRFSRELGSSGRTGGDTPGRERENRRAVSRRLATT